MKITQLELTPTSKYLFIKLHTDAGITGIGVQSVDNVTELFPSAQRSISCQIGFDGAVRDV